MSIQLDKNVSNVLLVNENLSSNLGDQAIHAGLLDLLGGDHWNVKSQDLSFRTNLETSVRKISNRQKYRVLRRKLRPLKNFYIGIRDYLDHKVSIEQGIEDAGLVIFGGGSLLIDNELKFPIRLYLFTRSCKRIGTPYIFLGVSGRSPVSLLGKFLLKKSLQNSKDIFVRDEHSSVFVARLGAVAKVSQDLAVFSKKQTTYPSESKIAVINVMAPQSHGRMSDSYNFKNYLINVRKFIEFLSSDYEIIIATTGDVGDNDFVSSGLFDDLKIVVPRSLIELKEVLSSASLVVATRLHCGILSLNAGKSPIMLSWDEKVDGYFNTHTSNCNIVSATEEISINKIEEICVGTLEKLPAAGEGDDLLDLQRSEIINRIMEIVR